MWKKRLSAAVVCAVALGMLLSDVAVAKKGSPKVVRSSKVTIDFEDREATLLGLIGDDDRPDFFAGTISTFRGCAGKQIVEVHHGDGELVGTSQAGSDGHWQLFAEDPGSDRYFARLTGFGRGRHRRKICARGQSDVLAFEDEESTLF